MAKCIKLGYTIKGRILGDHFDNRTLNFNSVWRDVNNSVSNSVYDSIRKHVWNSVSDFIWSVLSPINRILVNK